MYETLSFTELREELTKKKGSLSSSLSAMKSFNGKNADTIVDMLINIFPVELSNMIESSTVDTSEVELFNMYSANKNKNDGRINFIPYEIEEVMELMPYLLKNSKNTRAIIESYIRQFNKFALLLETFVSNSNIENSTGVFVDKIGADVGLYRFTGETDEDFKRRIRMQIYTYIASGSISGTENALKYGLGLDMSKATISEKGFANVAVELARGNSIDTKIIGGITDILAKTHPVGVESGISDITYADFIMDKKELEVNLEMRITRTDIMMKEAEKMREADKMGGNDFGINFEIKPLFRVNQYLLETETLDDTDVFVDIDY